MPVDIDKFWIYNFAEEQQKKLPSTIHRRGRGISCKGFLKITVICEVLIARIV